MEGNGAVLQQHPQAGPSPLAAPRRALCPFVPGNASSAWTWWLSSPAGSTAGGLGRWHLAGHGVSPRASAQCRCAAGCVAAWLVSVHGKSREGRPHLGLTWVRQNHASEGKDAPWRDQRWPPTHTGLQASRPSKISTGELYSCGCDQLMNGGGALLCGN